MINVVSRSLASPRLTGPYKVVANLMKGLDRIGYPYVVNRDISATHRLWVHDDTAALEYAHLSKARVVVGPNLYSMPRDIPARTRFDGMLAILSGPTRAEHWRMAGFTGCDLCWWPVGIDTEECAPPRDAPEKRLVMLYHKYRDPGELHTIEQTLARSGIEYRLFVYGEYEQADYLSALASTSFIVWHGCQETQGIALQEALSCGVPILICDVRTLDEERSSYDYGPVVGRFPGTAAPFFDERCGQRLLDLEDLPDSLAGMQERLATFRPRDFVLENLSLEKQAHEFVGLWQKWGMDEETGRQEVLLNDRLLSEPWQHRLASAPRRGLTRLGRAARAAAGGLRRPVRGA